MTITLAEAGGREPGPVDAPPGMAWIPGGVFLMGSDHHYPEEAPAHRVKVDGFWIDRFTVTNRDFERFVAETGYVTQAERPADPADYPGARPEMLAPSSTMFRKPTERVDMGNHFNGWTLCEGRELAPSARSGQLDPQADAPSRGACRVGGCRGLCALGGQGPPD